MKAAVLREVNKPLSIEDIAIDKPAAHEVLIRTVAAGVCHSDLHFQNGSYQYPMPAVLGPRVGRRRRAGGLRSPLRAARRPRDHLPVASSAGTATTAPKAARTCAPGRPRPSEPRTRSPRLAKDGQPVWQFLDLSSYAEQMLVHENAVVKITKDMPLDRAALIGCGVMTGVGAVINTARIPAGLDRGGDRLRRRRPRRDPGCARSPAPRASSPWTWCPRSSSSRKRWAPPTASTPRPAIRWSR